MGSKVEAEPTRDSWSTSFAVGTALGPSCRVTDTMLSLEPEMVPNFHPVFSIATFPLGVAQWMWIAAR